MGKKIVFSTNGSRTTGYPHAKNELRLLINSNQIKDLQIRVKTRKLLEEGIGVNP
jgi:hypothetical protein